MTRAAQASGAATTAAAFETNVLVSGDGSRVTVVLLNGRTGDDRGDIVAQDAMQRLYCAA